MGKIRVGIVGSGYRGKYLLQLLSNIEYYDVVAASDLMEVKLDDQQLPFYSGEDCLEQMIKNHELDLVVISSIWETHHRYAIEALQRGCNVALEVKGALYEGEYEDILKTALHRNKKVFLLENMVFDKAVMSIVEMCKKGIFGEIQWAKGAYRHDLRELFFAEECGNHWRAKYYKGKSCDLYPTHGIAPISLAMGINRNNKEISTLTSFSTSNRGVELYNPRHNDCQVGDVVTTMITTNQGGVLSLIHDTTLPRPKSLDIEIQGTLGIWRYEQRTISLEGITPRNEWVSDKEYIEKHRNELWLKYEAAAMRFDAHHQGMDYVMLCSMAEDLNSISQYPITPQDILFWTNITPWSRTSISEKQVLMFNCEL